MFRSIEQRLVLLSLLLVVVVAGATWLLVAKHLFWGWMAVIAVLVVLRQMKLVYKKFNSSVIFLLNALENGDYSFSFTETKLARDKREVNLVLNAIKEILVKARREEIENEKFLSLIVAAIPVGIVIIDERDFVKVANDAALKLLGMHVFTHVKQLGMVDEAVLVAFRELTPGHRATIRITDERNERLVSMGMSSISVKRGVLRIVSMHNIAGELEEREMESWIKLIRVMTHEIMNSIAPITSLSETMQSAWAEADKEAGEADRLKRNTVEAFGTITSTARGLLSFVESYRRFTGIPKPELRTVKLASFVENAIRLEEPLLRERGIDISARFSDPAITVAADKGQIGQVLVNLLKNAAEAIAPEQTDGRIEVIVSKGGGDGDGRDSGDGSVTLEVANNGIPIPAEVLPHIFVPFFTTKATGTGVGLSVSRYIMRLHGGNLKHHAEGGRTIFSMVFPVS
jgi:nitrogen fixation/metabolism regulation signal transduction histidine kinase